MTQLHQNIFWNFLLLFAIFWIFQKSKEKAFRNQVMISFFKTVVYIWWPKLKKDNDKKHTNFFYDFKKTQSIKSKIS